MDKHREIRPRRSWFAVWHWPKWAISGLVTAFLILYFLSPPFLLALIYGFGFQSQLFFGGPIGDTYRIAAFPLIKMSEHSRSVAAFYQFESDLIFPIFNLGSSSRPRWVAEVQPIFP